MTPLRIARWYRRRCRAFAARCRRTAWYWALVIGAVRRALGIRPRRAVRRVVPARSHAPVVPEGRYVWARSGRAFTVARDGGLYRLLADDGCRSRVSVEAASEWVARGVWVPEAQA